MKEIYEGFSDLAAFGLLVNTRYNKQSFDGNTEASLPRSDAEDHIRATLEDLHKLTGHIDDET